MFVFRSYFIYLIFFFKDTVTTEIYTYGHTLSRHDALPIWAMFGPREMLLSSEEPVVRQFLNAQTVGPIGMSEEKDADELAAEVGLEMPPLPPIPLQLE